MFVRILVAGQMLHAFDLYTLLALGLSLQESQRESPGHAQVRRGVVAAGAAFVLTEAHVQLPMQVVLDAPMPANRPGEFLPPDPPAHDVVADLGARPSTPFH